MRASIFRAPKGGTAPFIPWAGYSHLDVFMGSNAARDVFALILAELAE